MNQKILVVEDNPNSREILSLILQRMGHVVIEAYDAKKPSHARLLNARTSY
jgi:CheY-like chemotaxis protein